jgi:nitroreductase
MDIYEAILGRRSVRSYLPKEVPGPVIGKMLEAARQAPSASNIQPWKFIVVRDPIMVDMIRKVSPGIFGKPPALIVVCSDRERAYRLGGEQGRDYLAILDIALATENMVLVAYSLGFSTCIIKSFAESAVSELLGLPDSIYPELIVTVGYAKDMPQRPPKLALSELAYSEMFGRPWEEDR